MVDTIMTIIGLLFISLVITIFAYAFIESREYRNEERKDSNKMCLWTIIIFIIIGYTYMSNTNREKYIKNEIKHLINSSNNIEELKESLDEENLIIFYEEK